MAEVMDFTLELAKTKVAVSYLAEKLPLSDAERFYSYLSEQRKYLERRIAREKRIVADSSQVSVESVLTT